VAVTSASAFLSAPDITASHVPVNRIGTSLVILALKSAMVDEEFHIYNLAREYRSRSRDVGIVGWELRATLAGLLEDLSSD
jgi:hypothetical protein